VPTEIGSEMTSNRGLSPIPAIPDQKSGWLARMSWLAERPLRRRGSAATDKSIPGYVFVF
jgi:hypothetical protein